MPHEAALTIHSARPRRESDTVHLENALDAGE